MKITAWRIVNKKYAANAFSGEGSKLFGGRWNPPGHAAVYTADSLSLAILELIVHLDDDQDIRDYIAIPIEFDDKQVISWPEESLPEKWASLPVSDQTQLMGRKWLEEKKSLILKVPSSVVHHDNNFIVNPLHPDFETLLIGQPQALQFDPRQSNKLH